MKAKEYPAIEVETKYGTVTMSFRSPREEFSRYHIDGKHEMVPVAPLAWIRGELTINNIAIRVDSACNFFNTHYKDGKELNAPVREFRIDHQRAYNRRVDGKGWDYSAGYGAKLRELVENGPIVAAYVNNPKLIEEAERVFLWNEAAKAEDKVREASKALNEATKTFRDAARAAGIKEFAEV